MKLTTALHRGAVSAALNGLVGSAPPPFVVGARLELVTRDADRLVRGVVLSAGKGIAQLDVSNIGDPRKINLIAYTDVVRVRQATKGRRNGNWNPSREGRRVEEIAGDVPWFDWQAPR